MNNVAFTLNTSVDNAEYLNAVLDTIQRYVEVVHRECTESLLLIEEQTLAMEMYLNTFSMDYIRQCATEGVDSKSFVVRDVLPVVLSSGSRLYLRLRNPLPFPVNYTEPAALSDSHEYEIQLRSLLLRHQSIMLDPLLLQLRKDLEALRGTCTRESVLRDKAADLGVYVKKAIAKMDTQRSAFVYITTANEAML